MNLKQLINRPKKYKFGYVLGASALAILLVAAASLTGAAAMTDFESEPFELADDNDSITVEAIWFDDADSAAEADVMIYHDDAYAINGTDVSDDLASDTLNGTHAEFATVTNGTTYDIELNQSEAGTVNVSSGDIADDGTVDLTQHTSQNITSDDDILSVTATADPVVSDTIVSDPGNTSSVEYGTDFGLEPGTTYTTVVTGDDASLEDAQFSTDDDGALFASTDQRNMAIIVVAVLVGGAVYTRD